ncbi:hypothetical protein [Microcoleus sp. MON2_D5]|uniref:hypothetical protein n=1 Tax=Microcoleus sp. MON2_D5 TaxID=2818833 RepID=UPI002FCEEFD6
MSKQFGKIELAWEGDTPRPAFLSRYGESPSDVPGRYNESIPPVNQVSKQLSTQPTRFDGKHRQTPPTSRQFVDEA